MPSTGVCWRCPLCAVLSRVSVFRSIKQDWTYDLISQTFYESRWQSERIAGKDAAKYQEWSGYCSILKQTASLVSGNIKIQIVKGKGTIGLQLKYLFVLPLKASLCMCVCCMCVHHEKRERSYTSDRSFHHSSLQSMMLHLHLDLVWSQSALTAAARGRPSQRPDIYGNSQDFACFAFLNK